jgi:predicted phosphodiesterase
MNIVRRVLLGPRKPGEQDTPPSGSGIRVFLVSDLHTDHSSNLDRIKEWKNEHKRHLGATDVLIVAGDISSKLQLIETTLRILVEIYDKVIFVPGNNEVGPIHCLFHSKHYILSISLG